MYAGESLVCYAAKAYCAPWLLQILAQEGLGLDVVSGGELQAALATGFPVDRVYFHGNNKSVEELRMAVGSWCPFVCTSAEASGRAGLLPDIATEILARRGVRLVLVPSSYSRAIALLKKGELQAMAAT